jgi:hypothetical protein
VLDYDGKTNGASLLTEEGIRTALSGQAAAVSTTYSHTPERPSWRIVVPLASPITDREAYAAAARDLEARFPGVKFDPRSRLPEQLWYRPACPADMVQHRRAFVLEGAAFEPGAQQPEQSAEQSQQPAAQPGADQRRAEIARLLSKINLADAVAKLSGKGNRDCWVAIGQAAKDYEPSAEGEFVAWSATQPGFKSEADCREQWASFGRSKAERRVTIATLRWLAGEAPEAVVALPNDFPVAPAPAQGDNKLFPYLEAKHYDFGAPRPFIIKGLAAPGRVIELLGKPGSSKTALMCYTAKRVARGAPWFGRTTKRLAVVFVASEGRHDVLDRLAGYDVLHGADPNEAPIYVLPRVSFSSNDDRDRLISTIAAIEARGDKVGLLEVDTLAASTDGDENSTETMRNAALRVRSVAEHFNLAAMVAHHPTKSDSKVSRGAGAWLGAIDQQILVNEGHSAYTLTAGKQRQAWLMGSLSYVLTSANIGQWEDGEPISVPVVQERAGVAIEVEDRRAGLTTQARAVWEVFCRVASANMGVVTADTLAPAVEAALYPSGQASRKTVWSAIDRSVGQYLAARLAEGPKGGPWRQVCE